MALEVVDETPEQRSEISVLSELLRDHLDNQREQTAKLATSLAHIEARIGALEQQQGGASPAPTDGMRPNDDEDVLLLHLDDDVEEQKRERLVNKVAPSGWLARANVSAAAGGDGSLEEDSFVHRHARDTVDEVLKGQPSPKQLLRRGLLHPSRGFRLCAWPPFELWPPLILYSGSRSLPFELCSAS